MKKEKIKQRIIYLITIAVSLLFIFVGNAICRPPIFDNGDEIYYRAKVVEIKDAREKPQPIDDAGTMASTKRVVFSAVVKSGPYKGDTVEVVQDIDSMYAFQPREVKKGDEILISRPAYDLPTTELELYDEEYIDEEYTEEYYDEEFPEEYYDEEVIEDEYYDEDVSEGDFYEETVEDEFFTEEPEWILIEHNRIGKIIVLAIIFLLLIVIIGRKKGLSTILSLLFTVLAVFMVYIPSILKGFNVYLMTTIVSVFVIFMSLIIINGWNKKTLCAIFGNIMGVVVSGILAIIVSRAWNLTGMVNEEYVLLTFLDTPIDLGAVLWGGVIIGALGAIMDVAMSIASAMNELNEEMRDKTFGRMLRSGMNIGRDAIGTMTNTLILAYIGGALATVLLLVANNKNLYYLFNLEMIMAEILSAVVGSIGILAAVPATALFSAYVFNRKKKQQ